MMKCIDEVINGYLRNIEQFKNKYDQNCDEFIRVMSRGSHPASVINVMSWCKMYIGVKCISLRAR